MGGSAKYRAKKQGIIDFYMYRDENGNMTMDVENQKTGQVASVEIPASMWDDDPQKAIAALRKKAHQKGMYFPKKVDPHNDFHKVSKSDMDR